MQEEKITLRALTAGVLVTVLTTLTLYSTGHRAWAWGFLIGAALSLFSLLSLLVFVPILVRPGPPSRVKALLTMTLFMKLPLYAAGLYVATQGAWVSPIAVMLGIALVPMVLTLKAIGNVVADSQGVRETHGEAGVEDPSAPAHLPAQPVAGELVRERG